jgi:hypothetical protein
MAAGPSPGIWRSPARTATATKVQSIAGINPNTGQTVRLFHPRQDHWEEHFRWEEARLVGRTAIGRATVQVLSMNAEDLLLIRIALRQEGAF